MIDMLAWKEAPVPTNHAFLFRMSFAVPAPKAAVIATCVQSSRVSAVLAPRELVPCGVTAQTSGGAREEFCGREGCGVTSGQASVVSVSSFAIQITSRQQLLQ